MGFLQNGIQKYFPPSALTLLCPLHSREHVMSQSHAVLMFLYISQKFDAVVLFSPQLNFIPLSLWR